MITISLLLTAARGALLLGATLVAMPLLSRASAATRRLVLVFAFVAVTLLPIASAVLPKLRVELPAAAETDARALAAQSSPEPVARARAVEAGAATASPEDAVRSAASPSIHVAPATIALAVWALGAAIVLARLGVGLARARRLAKDASLMAVAKMGARRVEVRVSAAIETPAVTGLFAPVVLLPREALTWSEERRHVVLLHELAHVARRDCLAAAVAQLACAMHWYNPLTWIAARRLRIERELAADDLVLASGARASSYAAHLLELATMHAPSHSVPSGALAMAERSQIEVRIRALLASGRSRAPLGRVRTAVIGACATAIVSAVACATPDRVTTPVAALAPTGALARHGGASLDSIPRADLTIDPALQAIAEEETDRMVAEWKTRAAVVVVLDPSNGQVLAMTSRGPDAHVEFAAQRAIVPGSTVKPFVVAGALEEGVIQPTQRFDCTSHAYGDKAIHDASPHGTLDVAEILEVSSNIGTAKIVDALGGAKLSAWTKRFHFGEAPPLQLPNVAAGSVPQTLEDRTLRTAYTAIGEGMTATPMQMAAAFAALANGGVYHAPTLTKSGAAGERVLREDTAKAVMQMLEAVVAGEHGTGKAARVDGVRVAGKTGTAELDPENEDGDNYASFVGAAPLERPRYVVLVGAEAPRDKGPSARAWGGSVSAPVFARIVKRALAR